MSFKSTSQISKELAASLKKKRIWMKHSRDKAAELSGVPAPTIRRFEDTGEISFRQLLMLTQVYGDLSCFEDIFSLPKARTMDELIKMKGGER
ncbi:XRE family transcriptional regulator [Vibrio sp. JC009]|uniref:XRE family transcriptional regulator n=1 Tax=Vibrio sp. JC009 TaxID=2912314 RepID=UPI0023B192E8|nr:XRE family transcriptional regulator [Vibrio sp. JC009]WED23662.1 XRE family transcriptional regulator [Vibrio sp. JC009]